MILAAIGLIVASHHRITRVANLWLQLASAVFAIDS